MLEFTQTAQKLGDDEAEIAREMARLRYERKVLQQKLPKVPARGKQEPSKVIAALRAATTTVMANETNRDIARNGETAAKPQRSADSDQARFWQIRLTYSGREYYFNT